MSLDAMREGCVTRDAITTNASSGMLGRDAPGGRSAARPMTEFLTTTARWNHAFPSRTGP
jgi:hypothetical protein